MSHCLSEAFPAVAAALPRLPLARLPTPVSTKSLVYRNKSYPLIVKHDDVSGSVYGGNKIRKLEYLFGRARDKAADTVATFGTVDSNHALATALCAVDAGFRCICFLSHQRAKPGNARALALHLQAGTEVVALSGDRRRRTATLRHALRNRNVSVIPLGGTSWIGALGFVNAGLELAAQIDAGECEQPTRIYVAFGTMGTAVGLALGLALAGSDIETHAVRVTETRFANPDSARRLLHKTATLLNRIDAEIPADLGTRARLVYRDGYFGDGYAIPTPAAEQALTVARDELGLNLETTYTAKTLAALLDDLDSAKGPLCFWNTYNSLPLAKPADVDLSALPEEFRRYFD